MARAATRGSSGTRVGVAFENRDGSWNLRFDYFPTNPATAALETERTAAAKETRVDDLERLLAHDHDPDGADFTLEERRLEALARPFGIAPARATTSWRDLDGDRPDADVGRTVVVRRAAAEGERRFLESCARADTAAMALALDAGVSITASDRRLGTPLQSAIAGLAGMPAEPPARMAAIELLLARGAGASAATNALSWAIVRGDLEATRLLLAAGADIDTPDPQQGAPALFKAVSSGSPNVAIVRLLLDAGADVRAHFDVVRMNGVDRAKTALHHAAYSPHVDVVCLMLASGAAVDALDATGTPPLMCAAEVPQLAVVRVLLAAGADATARDVRGRTASMIREESEQTMRTITKRSAFAPGHDEVVSALRDAESGATQR